MEESLKNCDKLLTLEKNEPRVKALHLTTRFNLGYCLEHQSKFEQAVEIYSAIKQEEPTYTDAYLRLAYMQMA